MVSGLGFIVTVVWGRAIYCFLNQFYEPFLELPAHPKETGYERRQTSKTKNNSAAVYVGSSLTACTILSFLLTNCDGIS